MNTTPTNSPRDQWRQDLYTALCVAKTVEVGLAKLDTTASTDVERQTVIIGRELLRPLSEFLARQLATLARDVDRSVTPESTRGHPA